MATKRKSATEPVQDNAQFSEAALVEDVEGVFEEAPAFNTEEHKEKVVSEEVLTDDERKVELYYIIKGIEAERTSILNEANDAIQRIQSELQTNLNTLNSSLEKYKGKLAALLGNNND